MKQTEKQIVTDEVSEIYNHLTILSELLKKLCGQHSQTYKDLENGRTSIHKSLLSLKNEKIEP